MNAPSCASHAIAEASPTSPCARWFIHRRYGAVGTGTVTGVTSRLRRVAQPLRFRQRLELLQRVVLDLADSLSGDAEGATHFLERPRLVAVQAEAHLHHFAFTLRQRLERLPDVLPA